MLIPKFLQYLTLLFSCFLFLQHQYRFLFISSIRYISKLFGYYFFLKMLNKFYNRLLALFIIMNSSRLYLIFQILLPLLFSSYLFLLLHNVRINLSAWDQISLFIVNLVFFMEAVFVFSLVVCFNIVYFLFVLNINEYSHNISVFYIVEFWKIVLNHR